MLNVGAIFAIVIVGNLVGNFLFDVISLIVEDRLEDHDDYKY